MLIVIVKTSDTQQFTSKNKSSLIDMASRLAPMLKIRHYLINMVYDAILVEIKAMATEYCTINFNFVSLSISK